MTMNITNRKEKPKDSGTVINTISSICLFKTRKALKEKKWKGIRQNLEGIIEKVN